MNSWSHLVKLCENCEKETIAIKMKMLGGKIATRSREEDQVPAEAVSRSRLLTADEAGLVETPAVTLDLLCVVHRLLTRRTLRSSTPRRHLRNKDLLRKQN